MSMSLVRKIIAGDTCRYTRFHDEKGNFLDRDEWGQAPVALYRFLRRKLTGRVPVEPWWTAGVIRRVSGLLTPNASVIEFGSGLSTIWLARRCSSLLSVEHQPSWHQTVTAMIAEHGLSNVRLELRPRETYPDCRDIPDRSIDFAVIDGERRAPCLRAVWPKMKPGGWVYLDNSDKDMTAAPDGENLRSAEAFLREHCAPEDIECYTGFTINSFNTHQGMLCRVRPGSEG